MGTFSIQVAISVSSKTGSWFGAVGDFTDIAILKGINLDYLAPFTQYVAFSPDPSLTGAIHFDYSLSDPIISLDGGGLISFNSLPSGFNVISAALKMYFHASSVPAPDSGQLFLQIGSIEGPAFLFDDSTIAQIIPSLSQPIPITMLDIINNGFGIRMSIIDAAPAIGHSTYVLSGRIDGTYTTQSFTFDLPDGIHFPPGTAPSPRSNNGTRGIGSRTPGYNFPSVIVNDPDNPYPITYIPTDGTFTPGDWVRVTFPAGLNPDDVTDILITYPGEDGNPVSVILPDAYIIDINADFPYLIFEIPPYIAILFKPFVYIPTYPKIPIIVKVVIAGTTFTGSVDLPLVYVTLADTSGIYALSVGKTNDTLYLNIPFPTPIENLWLPLLQANDEIINSNRVVMPQLLPQTASGMLDDEYIDDESIIPDNFRTSLIGARSNNTIDVAIGTPFFRTGFIGG